MRVFPLHGMLIDKIFGTGITSNVKVMIRLNNNALSKYKRSLKNLYNTRQQPQAQWEYYKIFEILGLLA